MQISDFILSDSDSVGLEWSPGISICEAQYMWSSKNVKVPWPLSSTLFLETTTLHPFNTFIWHIHVSTVLQCYQGKLQSVRGLMTHISDWLWCFTLDIKYLLRIYQRGASLVVQWLRICLPVQGTWVQVLAQEYPTCRRATKPVCHNYWACALEPASHNYWAHVPQLLKPAHLEPVLRNKRSHRNEKPAHHNKE